VNAQNSSLEGSLRYQHESIADDPSEDGHEPSALAVVGADPSLIEEVDEYFEAGLDVRPGDVVLDVGANVGAFAMRAAARVNGALTLHCFEPAPSTYRTLEENLRADPALRRATTAWCLALTRREDAGTERDFFHFSRIPTNSTYDLADKRAEYEAYFDGKARRAAALVTRRVPLLGTRLGHVLHRAVVWATRRENGLGVWFADLFTGLRVERCRTDSIEGWARANGVAQIDVLKIDVEGAELDVLDGCGDCWPQVRCVAVETHARGGRDEEVVARLRAQGFPRIQRFVPRITQRTGLDNVLFVAKRADRARPGGGEEARW
jgi:FkbM family methyltransferase